LHDSVNVFEAAKFLGFIGRCSPKSPHNLVVSVLQKSALVTSGSSKAESSAGFHVPPARLAGLILCWGISTGGTGFTPMTRTNTFDTNNKLRRDVTRKDLKSFLKSKIACKYKRFIKLVPVAGLEPARLFTVPGF